MKKKVISLVLTAAMAAGLAVGCGGGGNNSSDSADSSTKKASSDGSVYLLNFKPETDSAWQDLAKEYTKETGVDVTVLTAADGQYSTQLQSEMAKNNPPTIFTVGNTDAAKTWNDYTLDLKDSDLYNHLTDKSLVINYDNKVAAIANCYECYGIIYNKKLLNAYCGLDGAKISSADDIKDLDTLEAVADDIQARLADINAALGADGNVTEAFASAGLSSGSSWRFSGHLANLPLYYEFKDDGADLIGGEAQITGKYLDNYKRVWDMYVRDSAADKSTLEAESWNAEEEFGMEEAVFYQNGDWEYGNFINTDNGYLVSADDLGMIPIYFGVDDANEGLCCGTENYWAVNAKASEASQKASLDFLSWVITSDEGRDAITNTMGLTAPFDTFTGKYESANPFFKDANALMAAGKTSVAWSFNATPNVDDWRADVVAALTAYTKGSGSWDDVKTAFVDGWSNQWALAHADD